MNKQTFVTTAIITAAILGMAIVGSGIAQHRANAQDNSWSIYENSNHGFKIQYPSSWIKNETQSGPHSPVVIFTVPQSTGDYASVNIEVAPAGHLPLDQFSNAGYYLEKRMFASMNMTLHLISANSTTLARLPAHKVVFSYWRPDGVEMTTMQTVVIRDNVAFAITSGGLSGGFPVYLPTFNKMIDSFTLIPTTNATHS